MTDGVVPGAPSSGGVLIWIKERDAILWRWDYEPRLELSDAVYLQ